MGLDAKLSFRISTIGMNNRLIQNLGRFFAQIFIFIVILLYVVYVLLIESSLVLIESIIVATICVIFVHLIHLVYDRKRPYESFRFKPLISKHWLHSSFPSAHTVIMFSLTTSLWLTNLVGGITMLVFAIIVAVSRVLVGVHYLSDIIAGALIGYILTLVIQMYII